MLLMILTPLSKTNIKIISTNIAKPTTFIKNLLRLLFSSEMKRLKVMRSQTDKFFLKAVKADVHFTRDTDSKVESLTLFQNGQEMLVKKTE